MSIILKNAIYLPIVYHIYLMVFISKLFGKFLSLIRYLSVSAEASSCHFKRNNDLVSSVQSSLKLNKAFPVTTGAFVMAVGASLRANC